MEGSAPKPTKRWVTEPDGYLEPEISEDKKDFASEKALTIIEALKATLIKHGSKKAMSWEGPDVRSHSPVILRI